MKIIFGKDNQAISDHAQSMLKAMEKDSIRHPLAYMAPKGVAYHTAQNPIFCDDCGETYWARDQYAAHVGCRKGKGKTGFT